MNPNDFEICPRCYGHLDRMKDCPKCGGRGFMRLLKPITVNVDGLTPVWWKGEYRPCLKCKKKIAIGIRKDDGRRKLAFNLDQNKTSHATTCKKHVKKQ